MEVFFVCVFGFFVVVFSFVTHCIKKLQAEPSHQKRAKGMKIILTDI